MTLPAELPGDGSGMEGVQWWLDVKGRAAGGLPFSRRFRVPVSAMGSRSNRSVPRPQGIWRANGGILFFLAIWVVMWLVAGSGAIFNPAERADSTTAPLEAAP